MSWRRPPLCKSPWRESGGGVHRAGTARRWRAKRSGCAVLLAVLVLAAGSAAGAGETENFTPVELEPLLAMLQRDGFGRETLNDIFYGRTLRKIPSVISLNTLTRETDALYKGFLTPYAIRKARRFRRRYYGLLDGAQQRFGVNKDIITAVLLVETQFGTYPLRFRILEVFTTLAVEGQPAAVNRHFERLKPQYPMLELDYLAERLMEKADWAYGQLVALLGIQIQDKHPRDIKGSYAGAFGMPQFLPTSYTRWAVDGNGDGRIDLDNRADAVHSIGNYLRAHGWRRGKGFASKARAVWEYNHSEPYVNTIFEVSRLMNLPGRKRHANRSSPHIRLVPKEIPSPQTSPAAITAQSQSPAAKSATAIPLALPSIPVRDAGKSDAAVDR